MRCLNEDNIIMQDCLLENIPDSINFCNQMDCTTGGKLEKKVKTIEY